MVARVLVVDDSGFFRRRVAEMLNDDARLEVIGMAENGQDAISKTAELKPDVITMDIEMPIMDGITATKTIMSRTPTPIIMFSSLTTDGAKATLDALDAGAMDFLPKKFEDIAKDRDEAKKLLCQRVFSLARKRPVQARRPVAPSTTSTKATTPTSSLGTKAASAHTTITAPRLASSTTGPIKLLAIGTSTGGPVALQAVLTKLPANFPIPIVLMQHMPGTFTPAFANRLDQLCNISVKEAKDGDVLKPGTALLAPGGMQMTIDGRAGNARVKVIESDPSMTYKPSVDFSFASIAKVYPKETLAVVLTGMGADGREGAKILKQTGSEIWAQDEASCVIYGMPAAIVQAGLATKVLDLNDIATNIIKRV
ncbi:MAG: chemotaxis response regulator protein-glutamate methylesterase [Gammaproteobacteria bacterium]|nr:chemotaxis response regulator protein-glutamate methylesterase [Gammaproteobacteria bacterium]